MATPKRTSSGGLVISLAICCTLVWFFVDANVSVKVSIMLLIGAIFYLLSVVDVLHHESSELRASIESLKQSRK